MILSLPRDVINLISEILDYKDVVKLSKCNKMLHRILANLCKKHKAALIIRLCYKSRIDIKEDDFIICSCCKRENFKFAYTARIKRESKKPKYLDFCYRCYMCKFWLQVPCNKTKKCKFILPRVFDATSHDVDLLDDAGCERSLSMWGACYSKD
jgi:hypothetical protein